MIGVQDFIGYYDWTFEYLRRNHGEQAVRDYWVRAISLDSQRHARALIAAKGFAGMAEYWGHTLAMEEAGYTSQCGDGYFRIDMFACPSKGHLDEHGLAAYSDYCEHCMGWIKPVMDDAGFVIHHEHNHAGQCYWEMQRAGQAEAQAPPRRGPDDVRHLPPAVWRHARRHLYVSSRPAEPEA
jgi:hypothetical protein